MSAAVFPLLFAASGASSLIYEVLWERYLRLSFGVSTYSVAVVTAVFMGGLSLGYGLGQRRELAVFHPLRVYALAEAAIALYALAFPSLLSRIDALYVASGGSLVVKTALALALLLLPTVLMGVTLPVGSRWLSRQMENPPWPPFFKGGNSRRSSAARAAAILLAANTGGGVVGTLATAWVLLRLYGAAKTTEVAVGMGAAVALAALASSFLAPQAEACDDPSSRAVAGLAPRSQRRDAWVVAAAFAAGFQTMALQVVWNRTLVCVVENNTTSFSLILASVLLGSAAGGALYAGLATTATSARNTLRLFVAAEVALCVLVIGSIPVLNRLYDLARAVTAVWPVRSVQDLCLVRWLVALAPVLPASAAGAFLLPVLTELRHPKSWREAAPAVSAVFAADAVGSVAGSLATGFGLIPSIGLGRSLLVVAAFAMVTALGSWIALGGGRRGLAAIGVVAVSAAALLFVTGPLTLTRWYDGHQGIRGNLLFYREGVSGTVSVYRVGDRKELLINCIEEVPNHRDALLLFKLLGHAPILLHGAAQSVLVNALGGGITLGAVLQHPVKVEAVELVPEVVEAMALFSEENGNAAHRPNWRLVHDDGRNYLRLTRQAYDVITADATHPAAGESWPLYTREYYGIVRSHLKPSGLFAQWLPLHNLIEADFLAAMKTFRDAFPEMLVLFINRYCMLIGSLEPIRIDPDALSERMAAIPAVAADLHALGIDHGQDLLKYAVLDGAGVDRLTSGAGLLTDDRASVEFAEIRRIGVAETFPSDLAVLLGGFDPAALSRRTGVQRGVFWARERLLRAELKGEPLTLEAIFGALVDLEGARVLASRDEDVEIAVRSLQGSLLQILAHDYEQILSRPDLDHTVEILSYAQQIHPEDPFLCELLGAAFLRLERWKDALPYLEQAAAERPTDLTVQSNLAYAYEQAGRYADALATLDRVEALDPSNSIIERVRDRVRQKVAEGGDVR